MSGKPTLYLLRHGQTHDNLEDRLTGQSHSDLTELGREQAAANGRLLRELIADRDVDFVASPLERARLTMELALAAAGRAGAAYRLEPRMMEIHFGDFTHRRWDDERAAREAALAAAEEQGWRLKWAGGESRGDLYDRVASFHDELRRDTVVVGHGGSIRMLRAARLGLKMPELMHFEAANAGIVVLTGDGETRHGY